MAELIIKDPPKAAPRYLLLKPFYIDDNYIAEGVEIEFTGTPNEQMEPLNDSAKDRMAEFLKLNGGLTPRIEDIVYQRMSDRPREVTMPHAQKDTPMMGGMTANHTQATPPEPKATIVNVPKPDVRVKKLMGTIVQESSDQGNSSI